MAHCKLSRNSYWMSACEKASKQHSDFYVVTVYWKGREQENPLPHVDWTKPISELGTIYHGMLLCRLGSNPSCLNYLGETKVPKHQCFVQGSHRWLRAESVNQQLSPCNHPSRASASLAPCHCFKNKYKINSSNKRWSYISFSEVRGQSRALKLKGKLHGSNTAIWKYTGGTFPMISTQSAWQWDRSLLAHILSVRT